MRVIGVDSYEDSDDILLYFHDGTISKVDIGILLNRVSRDEAIRRGWLEDTVNIERQTRKIGLEIFKLNTKQKHLKLSEKEDIKKDKILAENTYMFNLLKDKGTEIPPISSNHYIDINNHLRSLLGKEVESDYGESQSPYPISDNIYKDLRSFQDKAKKVIKDSNGNTIKEISFPIKSE